MKNMLRGSEAARDVYELVGMECESAEAGAKLNARGAKAIEHKLKMHTTIKSRPYMANITTNYILIG